MREILKQIAPRLRALGFRGSGQYFRKTEGDFVYIVNFQGSRRGDVFYVNLGVQPSFIPTESNTAFNVKNLKEYECVFRRRLGKEWHWEMTDSERIQLEFELEAAQNEFFCLVKTLRSSLGIDSTEVLLEKFSLGTTKARAALYLSRGCFTLGYYKKAAALADRGLELAGERAYILITQLMSTREITRGKVD